LSRASLIDLYYGDESRVCLEPCIPYGWQFSDEDVFMPSAKGKGLNCFGLLTRDNRFHFKTTLDTISSHFIFDYLEQFSLTIKKQTVIVLDNASVHTAKIIQDRRKVWQERGLVLFYLPKYSPHLNIIEILWRMVKYLWLQPQDYADEQNLFYQVTLVLAAVGTSLTINFSDFSLG
jgi:transposase